MYDELVEFLQESVTPFHAAATAEAQAMALADFLEHPQRLGCHCMAGAAARYRRLAHRCQPQRLPLLEDQGRYARE